MLNNEEMRKIGGVAASAVLAAIIPLLGLKALRPADLDLTVMELNDHGAVRIACYAAKHPGSWLLLPQTLKLFAGKLTAKQIATITANCGCNELGELEANYTPNLWLQTGG